MVKTKVLRVLKDFNYKELVELYKKEPDAGKRRSIKVAASKYPKFKKKDFPLKRKWGNLSYRELKKRV